MRVSLCHDYAARRLITPREARLSAYRCAACAENDARVLRASQYFDGGDDHFADAALRDTRGARYGGIYAKACQSCERRCKMPQADARYAGKRRAARRDTRVVVVAAMLAFFARFFFFFFLPLLDASAPPSPDCRRLRFRCR